MVVVVFLEAEMDWKSIPRMEIWYLILYLWIGRKVPGMLWTNDEVKAV